MVRVEGQRLLEEREIIDGTITQGAKARRSTTTTGDKPLRPASPRSVTVNLAESPLGWLYARGHISDRQFAAGERLRFDWERSQLDPRVTMVWDSAPVARGGGPAAPIDPRCAQIDARRRFHTAVDAAGAGLADILWRVVCAGEGMRDAERALGWPTRAGKLVLSFALDRVGDHYRLP